MGGVGGVGVEEERGWVGGSWEEERLEGRCGRGLDREEKCEGKKEGFTWHLLDER